MKDDFSKTWAIILAAGRGKRMKAKGRNKVTYELLGKPMISYTLDNIHTAGVAHCIAVVGYEKQSVVSLLGENDMSVVQGKRLGTGHAVKVALAEVPNTVEYVLVLYGDDSFMYKSDVYRELIALHIEKNPVMTFLTLELADPKGLGRIRRDTQSKVVGIVEEKDATDEQKKINEINPACYVFSTSFLRSYIKKIAKSEVTGEYYLTSLIEMAVADNLHIETLKRTDIKWRGINTPEELKEAENMLTKIV